MFKGLKDTINFLWFEDYDGNKIDKKDLWRGVCGNKIILCAISVIICSYIIVLLCGGYSIFSAIFMGFTYIIIMGINFMTVRTIISNDRLVKKTKDYFENLSYEEKEIRYLAYMEKKLNESEQRETKDED